MKVAIRFRYYKPVTPSLQVVELNDEQWREFFLLEDAEDRRDYMMKLLGKEYLNIKELWWIPLDDNMEIKVHCKKKEPKEKPVKPTQEQIEQYRERYQAEIRRIVAEEVPDYSPKDLETALNWLSDGMIVENFGYGCSPEGTAQLYMTYN